MSTLFLYTSHPSSLSLSLPSLILNSSCLNYSNNIPNGLLSLFYSCAIWFPHWFQNILSKRQIWVFIFPASSPTITPITFSFYCKHGGLAIENSTSSTTCLYFPLLYYLNALSTSEIIHLFCFMTSFNSSCRIIATLETDRKEHWNTFFG